LGTRDRTTGEEARQNAQFLDSFTMVPALHSSTPAGEDPMTTTSVLRQSKPPTVFEFEALEGLPCGCVAVAYRARPWDVALVSLEAKGPHCVFPGHRAGQVLHFGEPLTEDEEDGEE
jgi:hypothetical protein